MTPSFLTPRALAALPSEAFAWGCCIRDAVHFDYIYGAVEDYRRAVRHARAGDALHKHACASLDEARRQAEERAAELGGFYQGIGRVRALAALAYLAELGPEVEPKPEIEPARSASV